MPIKANLTARNAQSPNLDYGGYREFLSPFFFEKIGSFVQDLYYFLLSLF